MKALDEVKTASTASASGKSLAGMVLNFQRFAMPLRTEVDGSDCACYVTNDLHKMT